MTIQAHMQSATIHCRDRPKTTIAHTPPRIIGQKSHTIPYRERPFAVNRLNDHSVFWQLSSDLYTFAAEHIQIPPIDASMCHRHLL